MSRLCHGDRLSNWLIDIFPFQYMIPLISMQSSSSPLGRDPRALMDLVPTLGPHWQVEGLLCNMKSPSQGLPLSALRHDECLC